MSDQALIPIESVNPVEVFTGDKLDDLLSAIRKHTEGFEPDVITESGRKEIASLAYKVARSKTTIDNAGKELTEEWKAKSAVVDSARKKARDYLDNLRDEVRKPLNDWEAEQKRIEEEARLAKEAEEKAKAEAERLELERREAELREREEKVAKAEAEARAKEDAIKAKEAAEKAEKERLAREEQIRKEAEARAKQAAKNAKALAEKKAKEALAKAEEEKAEAVRMAEQKAKEAAEKAERDRIAAEERKRAEDEKRAADLKHRKAIDTQAQKALIEAGLTKDAATSIVAAIADGKIPNVTINY